MTHNVATVSLIVVVYLVKNFCVYTELLETLEIIIY